MINLYRVGGKADDKKALYGQNTASPFFGQEIGRIIRELSTSYQHTGDNFLDKLFFRHFSAYSFSHFCNYQVER